MWSDWAAGVLRGVGAPLDAANFDTLWAWSSAESGADIMRWNNPLNTTLPWLSPPSHPMNSVGVQAYMDEASGIAATVDTLLNGYYPVIVDHLRRSVPRSSWQDACPNLGTWGTGCSWISTYYGVAPDSLEATMDQATFNALVAASPLANLAGGIISTYQAVLASQKAILTAIGSGGTGQLSAADELLLREAHDAAQQSLADLRAIFKPAL